MQSSASTSRGGRQRLGRLALIPLTVISVLLTLLPPTAFAQENNAVVSVVVSITDPDTGLPVTEVHSLTMPQYRVDVAYSCSVAHCTDVEVFIAPTDFDPYYDAHQKEIGYTFTPPFTPAPPITGDLQNGLTVALGNVTAGTGGSFSIDYNVYHRPEGASHGSFFPDGYPIEPEATITASNAASPNTDTASATWVSTVPEPQWRSVSLTPNPARTEEEVAVGVTGWTRCFGIDRGGKLIGAPWTLCGKANEIVVDLPDRAEYVLDSGGSYDAATHTVTFSNSGLEAVRVLGTSFKVVFPSDQYPTSGDGCFDSETFTWNLTTTYLDDTVKSPAPLVRSMTVQNCEPFAKGDFDNKVIRPLNGGTEADPIVDIPLDGSITGWWQVNAKNMANVDGVATIVDNDLDQPDLPVTSVVLDTGRPGTIQYELNDGTADTLTGVSSFTAPDGFRIVAATVTSAPLAGPNSSPDGTRGTNFTVRFGFTLSSDATLGTRTNTASASITYPDHPQLGTLDLGDTTLTATLEPAEPPPPPTPRLSVRGVSVTVTDGGLPIAGSEVVWRFRGGLSGIPADAEVVPQYVYLAPLGWDIQPDGVSFVDAVPAGIEEVYTTLEYEGDIYNAVVVTWPESVDVPATGSLTLPRMDVKTKPTGSAPAGTNTARIFAGDANHSWDQSEAIYDPTAYIDVTDFDGDGVTTDVLAEHTMNQNLGASPAIGVTKEICRPDASEPDGCDWISNPDIMVGVPPFADAIKYRVTIINAGNASLSGIVAYDVLPYPGDSGTTDGTVGTPRGSTVKEVVSTVSDISAGLTLTYSNSTNPHRPEVYSGTTDPDDWDPSPVGASSIRAEIAGLEFTESVSFVYEAALVDAGADEIACNSVAVSATGLADLEPEPVCATSQEADFGITTIDRFPLQEGRVGVVPFVVVNHGGSSTAGAVVDFTIPAGVSLADLDIPGWECSASSLSGPADVTCDPVNGDGSSRTLDRDVPETMELRVIPDAGTADSELCFLGKVTSLMHDPEEPNEAQACSLTVDGEALLSVSKSDGVITAGPGDTLTYTIVVSNLLVAESVEDAVTVDTLPDHVEFVSASDGGTLSGADADGLGGVVTWPAVDLAAAGGESSTGDDATGAVGSTATRTVTVRVAPEATGDVVNLVEVSAPDPADPDAEILAESEDVDGLILVTVTKTADAAAAGVRSNDTITYTVTLTNDGTVDYTGGSPATLVDDLSGVLDDADFVSGSAEARVDGGPSAPVADPDGSGLLSWSGPLAVDSVVELTYQVSVGDGIAGDRVLTNTVFASDQPSTCTDGLDESVLSCASYTTAFAPVLGKLVDFVSQNDDGTWTVVYHLVVTNLNPISDSSYDLSDDVALGSGIVLVDAFVTSTPGGVTAEPWSGSGPVASGVTIPADSQHFYEVTVVADPTDAVGSPAGTCLDGLASGFANTAEIELIDGRTETAEACAEPVAPEVTKTAADPVQLVDGRWTTEFTVTVSNAHSVPGSLAYTLEDTFDIPSGITLVDVLVDGPADAPINTGFDGTSDTALLTGADRVPADSTRVFTVTLVTEAPAGTADASALACPPAGTGGYANQVTLHAGTSDTVLDEDAACADAPVQPTPDISKQVISSSVAVNGEWTLTYQIEVSNPDPDYSTEYTLTEELHFADDVTVVSEDIASPEVVPSGTWDGVSDIDVVIDESLAAGAVHTYTVTVVADPGTIDTESAAADCRIDAGEDGTGFRNLAAITSGAEAAFADACEPITDPSVVKTTVDQTTQDPDTGVWSQTYRVRVTNRSTTTVGEIPYTLVDFIDFPPGISITDVDVVGPTGAAVNDTFDGSTDAELAESGIGAAPDADTPAVQDYLVTVHFEFPAGLSPIAQCDPFDGLGGLRNEVEIHVGQRNSGDVACADVPEVPAPGLAKTIVAHEQQADGTWLVDYEIVVANPSETAASRYSLDDRFAFGDGITLAEPATIVSHPAAVATEPTWNGEDEVTLAESILLPAGGSHTYTVRAVLDTGDLQGSDPAADCVLDQGEDGTGLLNTTTLDTGATTRDTSACATIYDPGVTKQINGQPVQQADGSWLLSYTMTVTNPATVDLRYGLVDELDFPAGTTVAVESAAGRSGSADVVTDWNGQTQTTLVAAGTLLPANAVHVFDVSLRATLPATQGSVSNGWHNLATVESGVDGVITSQAEATADIEVPQLEIAKTVAAPETIRLGDQVEYEITITNVGVGEYTDTYPATVWDDLSGVLDDAELVGSPTAAPSIGDIGTTDTALWWRGPLASGEEVTVQYTVTVTGDGDANLTNVAFVTGPDADDPTAPATCEAPSCSSTSTGIPALSIEKNVTATEAAPGDFLEYTVRVTNTGRVDFTGAVPASITDDLSGVLDDAFISGGPETDIGTIDVSGTTLSWTGPLAAGDTATISYTVRVNGDTPNDAVLHNVAVADPAMAVLGTSTGSAETSTLVAAQTSNPGSDDEDTDDEDITGSLPFTGADLLRLASIAVLSLGLGFVFVLLAKRRRESEEAQ